MHLGDNLKRIRKEVGITQDELAKRSQIGKAQISKIEAGTQENPTLNTLANICGVLGVSIAELVFDEKNESEATKHLLNAVEKLPQEKQKTVREVITAFVAQATSDEIRKLQ